MNLRSTLPWGLARSPRIGLAGSGASAKDSGFKMMMTPKWTGFPYFEAAARGGKDAADELGDTFVYAAPTTPTSRFRSRRSRIS